MISLKNAAALTRESKVSNDIVTSGFHRRHLWEEIFSSKQHSCSQEGNDTWTKEIKKRLENISVMEKHVWLRKDPPIPTP
jgi:hypothetical protein